MPNLNRRYTDRDVVLYPALAEIATEYARNYTGTFEPMLNAQYAVLHGRDLNVGQARLVLNCLRTDVMAELTLLERLNSVMPVRVLQRRKLRVVDDDEGERVWRPHRLSRPATIRVDWGIAFNGVVIHRIDHSRGYYYDAKGPEVIWPADHLPQGFSGPPQLAVRWICGQNTTDPLLVRDPDDARALGHRYCATCVRKMHEREERYGHAS